MEQFNYTDAILDAERKLPDMANVIKLAYCQGANRVMVVLLSRLNASMSMNELMIAIGSVSKEVLAHSDDLGV